MQGANAKNSVRVGTDISSNFVDKEYIENAKTKTRGHKFKLSPGKVFLLLLGGYLVFSFGQTYWQIVKMNKEIAHYEVVKQDYLEEKKKLEAEFEKIQSKEYIERQARKKLGLVKPGETVIMPARPGEVIPLDKPMAGEIMD